MAENNSMLTLERDHAWNEYQSENNKLSDLQEKHKKLINKLKQVTDELASSNAKFESENSILLNKNNNLEIKLSKRDSEVKSLAERIQQSALTIQEITKQRNNFHQQCSVFERLILRHQQQTDLLLKVCIFCNSILYYITLYYLYMFYVKL